MKGRRVEPGTAKFVAIGIVLMVLADQFLFGGSRPYIEEARQEYQAKMEAEGKLRPAPTRVEPEQGEYFEEPSATVPEEMDMHEPDTPPSIPPHAGGGERSERGGSVPVPEKKSFVPHGAPKIAIIIDDLGMDVKRSREIVDLPAPVTLAFLPYGTKTKELAKAGKEKGHSLIIHAPMEAMDGKLNIGPGGLKEAMTQEEFDVAFGAMLASFEGYEGINNHMGSRLTADDAKMKHLMEILRDHNLFFVDSKTNAKSVAADEASAAGIPFAARDVFIDHVGTLAAARKALAQTEALALRRGYAIAIGHPKDNTIVALKEWLPTLKAKGIEVVPVKALLVKPSSTAIAKTPDVIPSTPSVITRPHNVIPREGGESMDPPIKSGDDVVGIRDNSASSAKAEVLKAPAFAGETRGDAGETVRGGAGEAMGAEVQRRAVIPDPDLPDPPDMFPEENVTVSEPASGEPEISLHPLPEQSPAP